MVKTMGVIKALLKTVESPFLTYPTSSIRDNIRGIEEVPFNEQDLYLTKRLEAFSKRRLINSHRISDNKNRFITYVYSITSYQRAFLEDLLN